MKKSWLKWGTLYAVALIIFFTGWGINQAISKGIGGSIMLVGILFFGFLLCYSAYKSINTNGKVK